MLKPRQLHPWNLTIQQARSVQADLCGQVETVDRLDSVLYVAGVDVGFTADDQISRAAVTVLSFPDLVVVDQAVVEKPTVFPYVTGYLSFREIPPILSALAKLSIDPQLILCDGQGLAHPRRFGLACHLGLVLNLPTIGVAKTLYIGTHELLPDERGAWVPLLDKGETIGAVLRTRPQVKPLYISIGHQISLNTAIDYVLRCTPKYRLPETTRQADRLSKFA
jgi:deoxyribonuclease V